MVKQFVMLPHEIVHSMYTFDPAIFHNIFTGVPGDLESYWAANLDLAESIGVGREETRQYNADRNCHLPCNTVYVIYFHEQVLTRRNFPGSSPSLCPTYRCCGIEFVVKATCRRNF